MPYLTHRPAPGNITEKFGPRPKPTPTSPGTHSGLDYGWGGGRTIVAARAGRVKSYGVQRGFESYGNRLVIDHGNGRETWYCHLDRATVAVGADVAGGQEIAVMGDSGNVTAMHLHFELRIDGVAVDPAPYFTGTAGGNETEIDMPLSEAEWTRLEQLIRLNGHDAIEPKDSPGPDNRVGHMRIDTRDSARRTVDLMTGNDTAGLAGLGRKSILREILDATKAERPASGGSIGVGLTDADRDDIAERVAVKLAARMQS